MVGSVDKEEAEEYNDGHGEKNSTIEHIFTQTKCANKLQINVLTLLANQVGPNPFI